MTTLNLTADVRNIHVANLGVKPALCVPTPTGVSCVISEVDGIRVVAISLDDYLKADPVLVSNGQPYPLSRFADACVRQSRKDGALARPFTRQAAKIVAPHVSPELKFVADTAPTSRPNAKTPGATATGLVQTLCAELAIDPKKARRILRKAGMNAPYTNETAIRAALAGKPSKAAPVAADATPKAASPKAPKKVASKKVASAPKAAPVVAQDGKAIDTDLTPASRKAASRRPSKAVKVPVEVQAQA